MASTATPEIPTTIIRPASVNDYDAASALFGFSLGDNFRLDPALWEAVCTTAASYRTIVAVDGAGAVTGLAVVVVNDRIRLAAGTRRRRFHVDDLIVAPSKRRQGVGRALLESVKAMAKSEAPSYVLINCDFMNVAARRTYEASGLSLARQGGDRFEIAFISEA